MASHLINNSSPTKKIVTVENGIQYVYDTNTRDGMLQLFLQSQKQFTIHIKTLCWSTDTIKMKVASLFHRFFSLPKSEFVTVYNSGSNPAIVAVSRGSNGNIVPLHLQNGKGIFCNKQYFLGSSYHASIDSKPLVFAENNDPNNQILTYINPIARLTQNTFYLCQVLNNNNNPSSSQDGVLFLQADTTIFKKQLQADESIHISYCCLVAAEESCVVQTVEVGNSSLLFMMRVRGPGNVYLCSDGKKGMFVNPALRSVPGVHNGGHGGAQMNPVAMNGLLGLIPLLCTLALVVLILNMYPKLLDNIPL